MSRHLFAWFQHNGITASSDESDRFTLQGKDRANLMSKIHRLSSTNADSILITNPKEENRKVNFFS